MAGKVVVSTLNDDTGVLATQNGMTGIAKAWVNFNGTGTVAIRDSFNVSSITDNGTVNYTINFTTHFATAERHHHTLSCRLDVVNVKLGEHAREVYSAVGCVVQRYVPEACQQHISNTLATH